MKIERGSVVITEIPYFDSIEVMLHGILLTRGASKQTCHLADVEAIRDALTEAIRIKREMNGVPAEPLRVFRLGDAGVRPRGHRNEPADSAPPRVFHENDVEPGPEITKVVDVDGATWHRHPRGWSLSGDFGSAVNWSNVLQFTPLTEVRDA